MQLCKKVLSITLVVMIIFAIAAPCFAAAAALSAAEQMVALWSLYTEAVGIDTVYSNDGFKSTTNNPFSKSTAASNIVDLYNQYCTYSGRVETINQTVDWIKANTEIAVSVQQKGAFEYSAGVTDFFNRFTTFVLEQVVGIEKNINGMFSSSAPWFNNQLYYSASGSNFIACPIVSSSPSFTEIASNGIYSGQNYWDHAYYAAAGASVVFYALYKTSDYQNSPNYRSVWFSESPFNAYVATFNGYNSQEVLTFAATSSNGYYTAYDGAYKVTPTDGIPIYNSMADAIESYESGITVPNTDRIQVGPKDIYNEGVIGIPDVDAEGYISEPLTGELDIPGADVNTIDDALPDILDNVLANVGALTDALVQGISTVTPFLPFGSIPSFNFGFSGIWHYVINWVNSLGSGLSFFSSIWSNIPYAMVVPIFAAAVVVIVTSIFKRFV